jgi:hypothetical protein
MTFYLKYRSKVENNVIYGHVKISIKTHGFHENITAYKRKDIILVYYISSLYIKKIHKWRILMITKNIPSCDFNDIL